MKNFLLFIVFIFSVNLYSQDAWNVIHYNEFNVPYKNICYVNPDEAWAIGTGDIAYTSDGGLSWETQYNMPDYYFVSIFMLDNQTGWVVGWSEVLKTTDGGQTWTMQELPNPLGLDVEDVFFLNQDTGWIAGSYKTIYYTEDGGANWNVQYPYELGGSFFLYDIQFYDNMNGCVVGGKLIGSELGIIMTTNNGGEDWETLYPSGSEEFVKVQYVDLEIIWACDKSGKLFKSTDGGISWELFEDSFGYLNDMHFIDSNNALTISSGYRVHITNDEWQSWKTNYLGFFGDMNKFSFADNQLGLGVGNESLFKTEDSGENWTRLNEKFINIEFFDEEIGISIQHRPNNRLMKTIDGGYIWEEINLDLNGYITNMDFISATTGFMTSSDSELLRTFDTGITWGLFDLPFDSTDYTDMQFMDENTGYLSTQNSNFIKTTDGGLTWDVFNFNNVNFIEALYFLDYTNGWIVGSAGFIGITTDGGETWNAVQVGSQSYIDVWFTTSQNGFILSNSGDVYRTDNGGYSWEGLLTINNSPFRINFISEQQGWIVCRNKIYFTEDNGNSWTEEFSIDWTIDRISGFTRLNGQSPWICTDNGRIYKHSFLTNIQFSPANTNGIKCYPNPAKEKLHVVIDQPTSNEFTCEVYSISGLFFGSQKVELTGNNTFEILLRNMPSGIYFLRVSDHKEVKTLKFIKG